MNEKIQRLIDILGSITIFSEYYSHEGEDCFKILNPLTEFREEKIVLCKVSEGFETAIDLALNHFNNVQSI